MRILKKFSILKVITNSTLTYLVPSNITYLWNFGSLALFFLIIQIISGLFISMHYIPFEIYSFNSVEILMREINFGWLLRYIHSNGASIFFFVVYIHIFRGLYYGSYVYPREFLWIIGVFILLLMIITAFVGYVLPWGQMSFWAATVILNLVTAIPLIGDIIVTFLLGSFSVSQATLNRFFTFHFLFPFIILGLVILHLIFLHENGSGNPLGINIKEDRITLSPYFIIKDFLGFLYILIFYLFLIFFIPNYLSHSDNYIIANPMITPIHIVPEWYFLFFYAILRSIPNKLGGVLALLSSILILILLPYIIKLVIKSCIFRPIYKIIFIFFVINCFFLGWIGGQVVIYPFYELGQIMTFFYFFYFLINFFSLNLI